MRISDWSSDVCSSDLSALVQEPVGQQIIPVPLSPANGNAADNAVVEYEPDEESILTDLLQRNIAVQVLRGLLENTASEKGSSMKEMDNATRNAGTLIKKTTTPHTKHRQEWITKEKNRKEN